MRWRLVCAAIGLLCACQASALELSLELDGLDAPARQRAQELAVRAIAHLPLRWRQDPRILPLDFKLDRGAAVVGHHRSGRLQLSSALLALPHAEGRQDLALATLIHEIAHAMDRHPSGGWSAQPAFHRLTGWDRPSGGNAYRLRALDAQEQRRPSEAFAVNVEGWLLDPEYACRRPQLAVWLSRALGDGPPVAMTCGSALPFRVASDSPGQMALEAIDPAHVYAVEYLLADSGGPPMSRFGHSMLRLVICAPGRAPSERCRLDVPHHRVLSFRAFVNDVQLSSWRGLTGGYPSRLFVLPMDQVIEEYTRVELRDLRSWPLALDAQQIRSLLQTAARTHWTYDGDYTFIGNNCAVETGRLLDNALRDSGGNHYRRTFPRAVLRRLQHDGLATTAKHDLASQREGRWMVSARAEYEQLLAQLMAAGMVRPLSLDDWLDASPMQRGTVPDVLTLEQAAAWLVLESAALRRAEQRAVAVLKPELREHEGDAARALVAWQQQLQSVGRDAVWGAGYGIPGAGEQMHWRQQVQQYNHGSAVAWSVLTRAAEGALPAAQQQSLTQSRERVQGLSARVRMLAAGKVVDSTTAP